MLETVTLCDKCGEISTRTKTFLISETAVSFDLCIPCAGKTSIPEGIKECFSTHAPRKPLRSVLPDGILKK